MRKGRKSKRIERGEGWRFEKKRRSERVIERSVGGREGGQIKRGGKAEGSVHGKGRDVLLHTTSRFHGELVGDGGVHLGLAVTEVVGGHVGVMKQVVKVFEPVVAKVPNRSGEGIYREDGGKGKGLTTPGIVGGRGACKKGSRHRPNPRWRRGGRA